MELYEVWNHLDSLACHCRSMIEEPGDVWSQDLIACRIAQACIEEIMDGMQNNRDERHGYWIKKNGIYECSECGAWVPHCSSYCRDCGTKMDERGEENK